MSFQATYKFGPDPGMPTLYLKPRGLAIFPVRYAVVPKDPPNLARIKLPNHMGDKTKEVALEQHKYALRQLREGYIYVYYHHQPKNKSWKIYKTKDDGSFGELSVPHFKKNEESILLAGMDHFFIDIEIIEQGSKVDFAFSKHPWSKDTLDQMEQDGGIRNRRMQTFIPQKWAATANPSFQHGMTLTEENLQKVFEFSGDTDAYIEIDPGSTKYEMIADAEGKHHQQTLERASTNYMATLKHADTVEAVVKEINVAPQGKNQPIILALWDSVGITQELKSYMLDPMGWVSQYQDQWEQHIHAAQSINNIQAVVEQKAAKAFDENHRRRIISRGEYETLEQVKPHPRGWPDGTYAIPYEPTPEEKLGKYGNKPMVEVIFPQGEWSEKSREQNVRDAAWASYLKEIDPQKLDTFNTHYDAFCTAATTLMNARGEDLVKWLTAPLLANALTEFHKESAYDACYFEDLIGELTLGLAMCEPTSKLLDTWLAETSVSEANLVWRAMAGNQSKGEAALNTALAHAVANKDVVVDINTVLNEQTVATLTDELVNINAGGLALANLLKSNKGIDIPTGGIDKLYAGLGNKILKPFLNPVMDSIGQLAAQGIFLARVGVNYKEAIDHAKREVNDYIDGLNAKKQEILSKIDDPQWQERGKDKRKRSYKKRFNRTQNKLSELLLNEQVRFKRFNMSFARIYGQLDDELAITQKNWEGWLKGNSAMEARFGVLLGIFQAAATYQLYKDYKRSPTNKELLGNLIIGGVSTVGVTADLASYAFKEGTAKYIAFKAGGAAMMAVGGVISAAMDAVEIENYANRKNYMMALVFGSKAAVNLFAAGAGITAVTVALNAALERRLATAIGPALQKIGIKIIGRYALFALFVSWGVWAAMIALGLDLLVLLIKDRPLQNWLEETIFAKTTGAHTFESLEKQVKALDEALYIQWGMGEPPQPPPSKPSPKNIPNFSDSTLSLM